MADGRSGESHACEVTMVPCSSSHAGLWHAWRAEDRSRRYNPLLPLTRRELALRLADVGHDVSDERRSNFRWMLERAGQIVGTVSLSDVSWQCGYGTLGIMVGEEHQGRGIASRALPQLVNRVFSRSRLHRVVATVSIDNEPSRRLFERAGFVREGTLREHFEIEGRRVDQLLFAKLRSEWSSPVS